MCNLQQYVKKRKEKKEDYFRLYFLLHNSKCIDTTKIDVFSPLK